MYLYLILIHSQTVTSPSRKKSKIDNEEDVKDVIQECIYQSYKNINNLKEQYKRASMKSEKMDIDDQIYDEEQKQKQLIKKLKGETTNG